MAASLNEVLTFVRMTGYLSVDFEQTRRNQTLDQRDAVFGWQAWDIGDGERRQDGGDLLLRRERRGTARG